MKFRELHADEIECRVAKVSAKGVMLLLYKNARCDMNVLDETVGPFGWQREHKELKGNIYCGISIKSKDGEWITKWDAGAESFTEKEKGEASDSFKRSGFNWGIGRELYTAPFIWVNAKFVSIKDNKTYDKFYVDHIGYTDGKITSLRIKHAKSLAVVFDLDTQPTYKPTKTEIADLLKLADTKGRTKTDVESYCQGKFNKSLDEIDLEQYDKLLLKIKNSEPTT